MMRYGVPVVAEFTGLSDSPTLVDVAPIVRLLIDDYTSGNFQRHLCYSQFISTMTQRPTFIPVLPMEETSLAGYNGENHAKSSGLHL